MIDWIEKEALLLAVCGLLVAAGVASVLIALPRCPIGLLVGFIGYAVMSAGRVDRSQTNSLITNTIFNPRSASLDPSD